MWLVAGAMTFGCAMMGCAGDGCGGGVFMTLISFVGGVVLLNSSTNSLRFTC